MRRIYLTAIPFQNNYIIETKTYNPVNFTSKYEGGDFAFIMAPLIAESMEVGDSGKLIVIGQSDGNENPNLKILRKELEGVGHGDIDIVPVTVEESQDSKVLLRLFKMITDEMEDNACYYADITFGPKAFAIVMMAALSYAENIPENTVIRGLYYQEIIRKQGKTVGSKAYNVEFLYSLSSLMGNISYADPKQKKALISVLLDEEG